MHTVPKLALTLTCLAMAASAAAQVTFYENEAFRGRSFTTDQPVRNFQRQGFNDRASSVVADGERWQRWEVCEDRGFRGRCVVLRPGRYASLEAMGLNDRITSVREVERNRQVRYDRYAPPPVAPVAAAPQPSASRIVFFENDGFQGRAYAAVDSVEDFRSAGFNDRASSAVVTGSRWEVCQDTRYSGSCVVLRPGQYPSMAAMGLNDRISSVRQLGRGASDDGRRYAPLPLVSHDYGRRDNERLYEAQVTSVRAVVENSGQRCWIEREQATQERGGANVPGAVLGAVIGGILGHQVGGGSGRDVATGIGVVAGAAIGGNSGRDSQQLVTTQNVQRCSNQPGQAHPAYWDVTYNFRGQDYRVQMTRPPGNTVSVNEQGEPRA